MSTPTTPVAYKVGDVIEFESFTGVLRQVQVTGRWTDKGDGKGPGFDSKTYWGYDNQIRRVVYVQPVPALDPKAFPLGIASPGDYTGPFPRKRHSHRCLRCGGNSVACYKAHCTKPQKVNSCQFCR